MIWFVVALPFAASVSSIVGMAPWCFSDSSGFLGSSPLECEALMGLVGPIVLFAEVRPGGDLMSDLPVELLMAALLSLAITTALALRRRRRRRREALAREAVAAVFEE